MDENILILKETSIVNILKAVLYDNEIIEIIWDTSIKTIEVVHLKQLKKAVLELGGGKKMPLFYGAHEFLSISVEGGKYAASAEGQEYSLANAFHEDNLAKKILFNFYVNYNKPLEPTKGFSTRKDAFIWLEKMKMEAKVKA